MVFQAADVLLAVADLALQISFVYGVVVGDNQRADACGGKVRQGSRAQAAAADHQRGGVEQLLLPFNADFVEQNMAAVAQELSVVHGWEKLGKVERGDGEREMCFNYAKLRFRLLFIIKSVLKHILNKKVNYLIKQTFSKIL